MANKKANPQDQALSAKEKTAVKESAKEFAEFLYGLYEKSKIQVPNCK